MRAGLLTAILLLSAGVASAGSKVAFRDDHTVLVDGRPYFPLGLVYVFEELEDRTGDRLKEIRALGFNTVGFYDGDAPDRRERLDRVYRAGLKAWVRGHHGFAIDNAALEKAATEQIRQLRDHPALLFWELQDEPIYNQVSREGSRKGHELLKREDPHHPLLLVEWPGAVDRFPDWRGISDLVATNLYPIPSSRGYGALPNKGITQMRDYLRALRKGYGDKPRLLVLQAWAWEPLKDGLAGYPTIAESRFMAYQSVIHGAKGLFYYGQFLCTRPNSAAALTGVSTDPARRQAEFEKCVAVNREFWTNHRPFFQELSRASAIFTLRESEWPIRLERETPPGGIEMSTRQDTNHLYALTVNAGPVAREATFRLPAGVRAERVHVLFEGRSLPVRDGAFTDRFQPHDVHVYATTLELPNAGPGNWAK